MTDDNLTHAELADEQRFRLQLCERLGLDPHETTQVEVEINPRGKAIVRWSGARRVPVEALADLLTPAARP